MNLYIDNYNPAQTFSASYASTHVYASTRECTHTNNTIYA